MFIINPGSKDKALIFISENIQSRYINYFNYKDNNVADRVVLLCRCNEFILDIRKKVKNGHFVPA